MKNQSGFTLIEIMVSVSIAVLITSIVLFSYSQFNDNIALSSAGQEMLIAIRQAQVYGLSVREAASGTGRFNYAYGIAFYTTNPNSYYLFVDSNGNKVFDIGNGCGSASTECVENIQLRNGVIVANVCNTVACPPDPTVISLQITFLRPYPDATIYFGNTGNSTWGGMQSVGRVLLRSPKGKILTVGIEKSGQISL